MFSKIIVAFSALAVLATAMPTPSVSQCNTPNAAKCCQTVTPYNSVTANNYVSSLVGVVLSPIDALVGIGCLDIVGGACSNTAVCCGGNKADGLVNVQCLPIVL